MRGVPDLSDVTRVRVVVSGRVQGVWFRDSCYREAVASGVSGWVRNNPDGTVEAAFEGPEQRLALMVEWCRVGPPRAVVVDVEEFPEAPNGERGFRVR